MVQIHSPRPFHSFTCTMVVSRIALARAFPIQIGKVGRSLGTAVETLLRVRKNPVFEPIPPILGVLSLMAAEGPQPVPVTC